MLCSNWAACEGGTDLTWLHDGLKHVPSPSLAMLWLMMPHLCVFQSKRVPLEGRGKVKSKGQERMATWRDVTPRLPQEVTAHTRLSCSPNLVWFTQLSQYHGEREGSVAAGCSRRLVCWGLMRKSYISIQLHLRPLQRDLFWWWIMSFPASQHHTLGNPCCLLAQPFCCDERGLDHPGKGMSKRGHWDKWLCPAATEDLCDE